jgi:hypothetical protein
LRSSAQGLKEDSETCAAALPPGLTTSILRCRSTERQIGADPDDLHSFGYRRSARHDGFFLSIFFDPNLAIETVAVPAEVGVRNIVHLKKLKTAKYRIVLGNASRAAEDLDLDEAFVWREHFRMSFHFRKTV